MRTVLTIAGFDPSSGAGTTADLKVFAAHGLFGTSAITALTVQSTVGVRSVHPVDPVILRATLDCLGSDLPPAGVKIGMLGTAGNVAVVAEYLDKIRAATGTFRVPIVLDPVLRSSSGRELLEPRGVELLRSRLLPLVDWVTPNVEELSSLTGRPVKDKGDVATAAGELQASLAAGRQSRRLGVLATGGHLEPPDDLVVDPAGESLWLEGVRIETRATHGTGCALSSAFLCELVIGRSPGIAAVRAKEYVASAMRQAVVIGSGRSPMNHLWKIDKAKRGE